MSRNLREMVTANRVESEDAPKPRPPQTHNPRSSNSFSKSAVLAPIKFGKKKTMATPSVGPKYAAVGQDRPVTPARGHNLDDVLVHLDVTFVSDWLQRANTAIVGLQDWWVAGSNAMNFSHFWLEELADDKRGQLLELEYELLREEIRLAFQAGMESGRVTEANLSKLMRAALREYPAQFGGDGTAFLDIVWGLSREKTVEFKEVLSNINCSTKNTQYAQWLLATRSFTLILMVSSITNFYRKLVDLPPSEPARPSTADRGVGRPGTSTARTAGGSSGAGGAGGAGGGGAVARPGTSSGRPLSGRPRTSGSGGRPSSGSSGRIGSGSSAGRPGTSRSGGGTRPGTSRLARPGTSAAAAGGGGAAAGASAEDGSRGGGGGTAGSNRMHQARPGTALAAAITEADREAIDEAFYAAKEGQAAVLYYLLSRNRVHFADMDDEGRTLLLVAVSSERLQVVAFLLENADQFEVNVKAKSGNTALHIAASNGSAELVEMLLNHGADPAAVNPVSGVTPKELAEVFAEEAVLKAFARIVV